MKKLSLFISFLFILGLSTTTWADEDAPAGDIQYQTTGGATASCDSGNNNLEEADIDIVGTPALEEEDRAPVTPAETGSEAPAHDSSEPHPH